MESMPGASRRAMLLNMRKRQPLLLGTFPMGSLFNGAVKYTLSPVYGISDGFQHPKYFCRTALYLS